METKSLTGAERMEIVERVAKHCGFIPRLDMMMEECGEMIVTINRYKRQRVSTERLIEEFADIWIVLKQMGVFLDESSIANVIDYKLRRIDRVINELKNN